MTGAPRQFAAPRASFNDIISIGELIKSVKEDNVGIKKIAEKSGYAFQGRYHDPELNDFYYEDVYYKNCMVAADGSPIKYGKGNSSVLIAGSVGFGPFVSIRVYNKRAYNYIKSELKNKFHFKTAKVDGKWATLNKGNVVVDVSVDGNAYGFTFYIKQALIKNWRELNWDRVRTKLVLADMPLRLEDRLADIAFGKRVCQPLLYLYCAVYGDSGRYGDFFANKKFGEISL